MAIWPPGGYGAVYYTEKKQIKVAPCEPRNPVYLKWVGTKGGWNFFMFGINQIEGLTTTSGGLFAKFNENIGLGFADSDSKFLTKEAIPELILGADNLDNDDIGANPPYLGLKSLLISPQVMMLLNPQDRPTFANGEQWKTVKVDPSKFKIRESRAANHSIEFVIKLVELNIQSQ